MAIQYAYLLKMVYKCCSPSSCSPYCRWIDVDRRRTLTLTRHLEFLLAFPARVSQSRMASGSTGCIPFSVSLSTHLAQPSYTYILRTYPQWLAIAPGFSLCIPTTVTHFAEPAAKMAGLTVYNLPSSPPIWDGVGIFYLSLCIIWAIL